jgi:hypothetical protein
MTELQIMSGNMISKAKELKLISTYLYIIYISSRTVSIHTILSG